MPGKSGWSESLWMGMLGWWLLVPCGVEGGTRWVWGARGGWEGKEVGELMEKYSEAPSEVRISRGGLLAALVICMYYVKLSWQQGELPCELSEALQWEADLELLPSCHLHSPRNGTSSWDTGLRLQHF